MTITPMTEADYASMAGQQLVEAFNRLAAESGGKVKPVKKFENREIGVRRCVELQRTLVAHDASDIPEFLKRYPTDNPPLPAAQAEAEGNGSAEPHAADKAAIAREADARWRNWTPTKEHLSRPTKATFARMIREERKAANKSVKKKETIGQIPEKKGRLVPPPDAAVLPSKPSLDSATRSPRLSRVIRTLCANPRRPGTDSHRFFEAMIGGPTVAEYVNKFDSKEHKKAAQWLWNTVRDGYAKVLG